MTWFDVDKAGLAAILERRGKAWAVLEPLSNAWDAGAKSVRITLTPIDGEPYATLVVEDDAPEGWPNLDHAFTMFAHSRRAKDPEKRGRFNLGEKLVLAIARTATLQTMNGSIHFQRDGRRYNSPVKRDLGTMFTAEIRMTREELQETLATLTQVIPQYPPGATYVNGVQVIMPKLLTNFIAKLPTEIADGDGCLRRSVRSANVGVYDRINNEDEGQILEMGIPVCDTKWPWRVNVLQKVPLNLERDGVTDAFRRALQVAVVNAMAPAIDEEQVSKPWVQEAIGDSRASPEAVKTVIIKQFGENAVIATPGQPLSNAQAAAMGHTVIAGGSLSADVWANVRKHDVLVPASKAFPTSAPKDQTQRPLCPTCGKPQ